MPHEIHLLVFHQPNGTSRAHRGVFIPSLDPSPSADAGTLIHLTASFEYFVEIRQQYNTTASKLHCEKYSLGAVADAHLANGTVEEKAMGVAVPGSGEEGEDCQTWIRDYVDALIADGILTAGARIVLEDAPVV